MAGPSEKPMPNAAPSMPIPLARFSRVVMSLTYAWAVEIFPPEIPSITRDT